MKNHKSHKLSDLNINGAISEVYMMDCVEAMKQYPDKYFSLSVCDPPYGININMNMGRRKGEKKKHKDKEWDNDIPANGYFKELFRVSQQQIIFGGNYFTDYLRPTQAWIFWDKDVNENVSFSDGELAWTSFKMITRKVFIPYSGFRGADKDGRYHPTQKPVALYDWIFKNYAKEGDLILDTHLGSQSSRIAANRAKLDFIGFEIDEDYFNEGNEKTTEYIIVDGATDATKLKRLFNDRLMIREAKKKQYSIKMPQIIITSQNALKVDVPHTHINCDLFYDEVHWRMKRK